MRQKVASAGEIRATFDYEYEQLFWMALLITADEETARKAIRNASALPTASSHSVFHDWLIQWVKCVTIRSAAALVRKQIECSAEQFKHMRCEHGGHAPLAPSEVDCLRTLDRDVVLALDTIARTVLVFRGIQHASIGDCALSLGVSRVAAGSAYCRSLTWLRALSLHSQHRASRPADYFIGSRPGQMGG